MNSRAESYNLLRYIAGEPRRPVKAALNRVVARIAPYLPLSLSRIEDIWYGEVRLIRAEEIDAFRAAAEKQRQNIEAGRAAANDLARSYLGIAERLRAIDPDFYGPEVSRLERQADSILTMARAGTQTDGGRA